MLLFLGSMHILCYFAAEIALAYVIIVACNHVKRERAPLNQQMNLDVAASSEGGLVWHLSHGT